MGYVSFESCLEKQEELRRIFSICSTPEAKYQKIIELGRQLPPLHPSSKIPENLVPGCQSTMYLEVSLQNGKLFLNADSEALISKGLAALLIKIYSGETPQTCSECPPTVLREMGLHDILSPTRSNGLSSLYHKLRSEALKHF